MTYVDYSGYQYGAKYFAMDDRQTYLIKGGDGNDTLSGNDNDDTIEGGKGKDCIIGGDGDDSLLGGAGNDTLIGGDGADIFVYNKGDGNDTIVDYAEDDKLVFNSDTVKKFTEKNGDYIITLASKAKVTIKGGANKVITYSDETGEHTYPETATVICNSDCRAVTLTSSYMKDSFDTADYEDGDAIKTIDASEVEHDLTIIANKLANKIIGTEEDDYIDGGAGRDTLYGGDDNDTLVGGKGNDMLYGGDGENIFVYNNGDGNDTIVDYTEDDIIYVAGTVNKAIVKSSDVILTVGKGKIIIKNAAKMGLNVVDYTTPGPKNPVEYNDAGTAVTLNSNYTNDQFTPSEYSDYSRLKTIDASAVEHDLTITANKLANKIIGTGNDDYIDGAAGADKINGGAGKDTLWGGKGNDSLVGGDGKDIFVYNNGDGNDTIVDYVAGDKISIGTAISKATLKGSDVVFTIGKGTLTVKDGANKKLSMINSKGKTFETLVSDVKTLTINNKTKSPVKLDSDVGTADASKRTSAVKIVANKLDNVILGGSKSDILYGESGNDSIFGNSGNDKIYGGFGRDTLKGGKGDDTLIGGAGNDSLWGDSGADTFIYHAGEGKDVIFGFDKNDTLTLDSLDFTATYKSKAVTLKFEEGSVTLKDFTAKTFHINDDTYKISGSKFVKK